MNERTLRLLEFDVIRARVADRCLSGEAAAQIMADLPALDPAAVSDLKALTGELAEMIAFRADEPRGSLPTIGPLLAKLRVEGMALELEEAYAVGVFAERATALKSWLTGNAPEAKSPVAELARALPDCASLVREVFRIIDRDGSLRDLPELREIKRRIQSLQRSLEAITARYTNSDESRRMLQSDVPAQRDGRLVLAVKVNYKSRIRGIVHEVSATGQTVFLEPAEVVEKNNEIVMERRRLDAEIARLLRELTGRIAEKAPELTELHRGAVQLETLRARARYGRETRGVFAATVAGPLAPLVLRQARHPLIGATAVPIDLAMDETTRMVIITGPNTGGKTVALKTVGLLALMNQFGLAVPAQEGTALPIFDGVYADIGDEQSISQSLSTFSSHMTNIADIARSATRQSLVLLDELGSGTDPEEGSAIAMAILDHFLDQGSRLLCTTHHGMLKNYGYSKQTVQNASVEFDRQTLGPTYRIIMGIPGESRALDIAGRNGLQESIVQRARGYLDEERADISALIAGLKQKHQELAAAADTHKSEAAQLREERRKADLKELRLRQKELELRSGNVSSLGNLLTESRKTLENLVRELKEGEITREKTLKVKEFLADLERTAGAETAALADQRRELETLSAAGETTSPIAAVFRPGLDILAGPARRRGRILRAARKGQWVVEIGALKMTLAESDLVPLAPSPETAKPLIAQYDLVAATPAQLELNLRGLRLEEALEVLRNQMDAAVLSGLYEFSVIHGKGDGILQRGVHEFLKKQKVVADFGFSRPEQGGYGKTVVSLKRS